MLVEESGRIVYRYVHSRKPSLQTTVHVELSYETIGHLLCGVGVPIVS